MPKKYFALAIAALLTSVSPSIASDYAFRLHNKADGYTINGFYTFQDGQWSQNWLDTTKVPPGASIGMDWNSNQGNCVVPFRVSWDDYGAEDFKIDWCKGVKNIYMKNKGFSWD
ncbi:conserved protein of unknown function [Bradyrhizobium sp. ORS 285]|uniref:hypothetical protein n=1 Tax=Bradyrhizobium sp. ORS 285 TaxID=115808 RepID=UPI00024099F5|nr:hypothetical protein [Bradyrhizobium sp. ORS 285]CCD84634.1 conserved hypothetical protein [Bradyrhizobium sp. ORS 285]SMX57614.1 conserved protein of unknown function [Bradyrhizobium sp. ORS 285]